MRFQPKGTSKSNILAILIQMLLYQIFLEMSCSRSSGASREHLSILFKFDKTCKKNQSLKLVKTCNKSILSKAGPCKETHRLAPQKWQYKSYQIPVCHNFNCFLAELKGLLSVEYRQGLLFIGHLCLHLDQFLKGDHNLKTNLFQQVNSFFDLQAGFYGLVSLTQRRITTGILAGTFLLVIVLHALFLC